MQYEDAWRKAELLSQDLIKENVHNVELYDFFNFLKAHTLPESLELLTKLPFSPFA